MYCIPVFQYTGNISDVSIETAYYQWYGIQYLLLAIYPWESIYLTIVRRIQNTENTNPITAQDYKEEWDWAANKLVWDIDPARRSISLRFSTSSGDHPFEP
jgi:hypothetical protein